VRRLVNLKHQTTEMQIERSTNICSKSKKHACAEKYLRKCHVLFLT